MTDFDFEKISAEIAHDFFNSIPRTKEALKDKITNTLRTIHNQAEAKGVERGYAASQEIIRAMTEARDAAMEHIEILKAKK